MDIGRHLPPKTSIGFSLHQKRRWCANIPHTRKDSKGTSFFPVADASESGQKVRTENVGHSSIAGFLYFASSTVK